MIRVDRRRSIVSMLSLAGVSPLRALAATETVSIKAPLLDGQTLSTDDLKGKVILVNFWASWCGPCRVEMPEVEAYYRQNRAQGLEVLALSMDELADESKVREAAKPFTFHVAMYKTAQLKGFGRIWRMPVSAVIDRHGHLAKEDWFVEPKLNTAALDALIKPLL